MQRGAADVRPVPRARNRVESESVVAIARGNFRSRSVRQLPVNQLKRGVAIQWRADHSVALKLHTSPPWRRSAKSNVVNPNTTTGEKTRAVDAAAAIPTRVGGESPGCSQPTRCI